MFLPLGLAVTALYELAGFEFLRLPWTPVALIGTAVAFLISFQNNAAYERIWEVRKIWGGIVNESRMLAIMLSDMVTNEYANEPVSDEELEENRRTLIYRHIG